MIGFVVRQLWADDSGQGLLEYGLIIAVIVVIAIAGLKALGNTANNSLTNAANILS
jgi:pilus assembly protein Flp/PilA